MLPFDDVIPVGAVELKLIVTVNEQLDDPHRLVEVHVTVVVPVANVLPLAGEQTTTGVGVPDEVGFVHTATWLSHCVMFDGHALITGVTFIVTVNVQLDDPHELVAVQVTVEVPVANVLPDNGEHATVAAGVPDDVGSVHVAT